MTKNFKSYILSALAVAAIAFTGCSKNDTDIKETIKGDFSVELSGVGTKTTNEGLSTLWAANDAINLFHVKLGGTTYEYVNDGKFTTAAAGATATFTGELGDELDPEGAYSWYAFYPYVRQITTPENSSAGYTYVGCRSNKSQVQNGNDNMDHIAGSNYPVWGVLQKVPGSEKPHISMKHATSLVAVHVKNGTADPISVTKVSLTTDGEDVVGQFYIDFSNPVTPRFAPRPASDTVSYTSNVATLEVQGGDPIDAEQEAVFYFAVKPFTVNAGDALTLTVSGSNGEQVMEISADRNIEFKAGKIKHLDCVYETAIPEPAFTDIYTLNSLAEEAGATAAEYFGMLTDAVVSFVPTDNVAIITDGSASIYYYKTNHGLKQGQTFTGNLSATVMIYSQAYSEMTATSAAFEGDGEVVNPKTLTVAQLIGNYFTYQNTYAKLEGLEVTEINGNNISVTDGTNTYIVYLNAGTTKAVVGDKISAIGTITKFQSTEELKVWKAEDITITSHTPTEHAINIVQPTDAGTSSIKVTVDGTEITSGTKVMEGKVVQAEVTIDGDYDFTTWDITGAEDLSSPKSHIVTFKVGTQDINIAGNFEKRGVTYSWVKKNISELKDGDVFVLVGNNGSDYALSNNNGTSSAPSAVAVTVSGNKLASDPATTIQWIAGVSSSSYIFYTSSAKKTWLYCTNNNNGLRVGNSSGNSFVIKESYLFNSAQSRYVGIYTASGQTVALDWRSYTSINNNIKGQTFSVYVKTEN